MSNTGESPEELEERRENEVEALKAIFDGAVTDLREQDVWKTRRPPELRIRIYPPHSVNHNEAHVAVTLAVKCDQHYPLSTPEVQLIEPKGLAESLVRARSLELQTRAQQYRGLECIYPLTELVQQFLHEHNAPAIKSFYEQMVQKQERDAQKAAEEERRAKEMSELQKENEYRTIEKRVEERKTMIMQEDRSNNRVRFEDDSDFVDRGNGDGTGDSSHHDISSSRIVSRSRSKSLDVVTAEHGSPVRSLLQGLKEPFIMEMKSGKKRKLMLIKSFAQNRNGVFVHYALDMDHSNNLVVLNEWIFRWSAARRKISSQELEQLEEESKKYLRQLDVIDSEFQSLSKLKNSGLVGYIGWSFGFQKDHVFAHVLKEYIQGTPLTSFLKERAQFSIQQIKLLSRQILTILSYLHSNNVPHRHILPSSVFLNNNGKFVLADFAVQKRLEEIYLYSQNPTGEFTSGCKSVKKGDILQFGNLICAMAQGDFLKTELVETPFSVPSEMKDFLRKCLQSLDKDRWSAEQLLRHPFIAVPSDARNDLNVSPTEKEKGFYSELQNHIPDDDGSDLASQLATRSLALPTESRLHREFEILEFCGRGGFGDVLKVRNVLDGRTYAIKRIPLNEAREKLNKRILREVQLLSRLNHENIVRYYNSWIESVAPGPAGTTDASFMTSSGPSKSVKKPDGFVNSLGFGMDDIENNAPPAVDGSVEWSADTESGGEANSGELSPVEDGAFFGQSYPHKMGISTDSSADIEFETNGGEKVEVSSVLSDRKPEVATGTTAASSSKSPLPNVVLFIQMEFCEKSTLRNCIDEGLYKDQERVWRLFREIVEGIGHIHQQGVIHRDLKPANIFIDSQEHVRLGDFGLATHTLMSRSTFAENVSELSDVHEVGADEISRTGRVGTALYVAPELVDNSAKATYSQKVDMYSLGICFFEMFYPLPTGMERTKVLSGIRKNPPQFPSDFDMIAMQRQATLVKWLCDHDPRKRPNAVELLQSDLLPPPKIEDAEMNEIIRHTVQNPQSKAYKRLMTSLFSQRLDPVLDQSYDFDVQRALGNTRSVLAFEHVQQKVTEVFHLHGAVFFGTPLLMPRPDNCIDNGSVVSLMDTSGDIVTIPQDLRIPFARYVARNKITQMKRFCIDRVFRSRKSDSAHPRELYECAFDIISTSVDSLIPDAECVAVVNDIIKEFPTLSSRSFRLRVTHSEFLKAAFLYAGVSFEKLADALTWLNTVRSERLKEVQAKQLFASQFDVEEQKYIFLERFLRTEDTIAYVDENMVKQIAKRKGMAAALAKKALQECENFLFLCEKMGCSFPVDVCLGLTDKYMRNGILFHVVQSKTFRDGPVRPEIFAVGGRYSGIVQNFKRGIEKEFNPVAVGVSIAFEKLLAAVTASPDFLQQSSVDALICTLGSSQMVKEEIALVRELRSCGIRADILSEISAIESTQTLCKDMRIHLIQMKDNACIVRFVENDKENRITERRLGLAEVTEWMVHKIANARAETNDTQTVVNRSSGISSQISEICGPPSAQIRSSVKVQFCVSDTAKLQARDKKRHSNHILTILEPLIATFVANVNIEVLAMDLPGHVLKWLPVHLSFLATGGRMEFHEWPQLCDKFPRHRKFFNKLHDDLQEQSFELRSRIVVFSYLDDTYRLIS